MLSKIDHEFGFLQTAMSLRSRRQEVLASNLANSDTPNYKARDIDFSSALRSAMAGVGGPVTMARTSERHIAGTASGSIGAGATQYRSTVQPSLDGNTVDPDVERAHFAENAMHYQFLLERMRSSVAKLKTALSSGQ